MNKKNMKLLLGISGFFSILVGSLIISFQADILDRFFSFAIQRSQIQSEIGTEHARVFSFFLLFFAISFLIAGIIFLGSLTNSLRDLMIKVFLTDDIGDPNSFFFFQTYKNYLINRDQRQYSYDPLCISCVL